MNEEVHKISTKSCSFILMLTLKGCDSDFKVNFKNLKKKTHLEIRITTFNIKFILSFSFHSPPLANYLKGCSPTCEYTLV